MGILKLKLLQVIPVLLIVTLGVSILIDLIPGSPALSSLGPLATNAAINHFNATHGLNLPLFDRYYQWWEHLIVHGSLGISLVTNDPVRDMIGQALPVTLEIAILALVSSLCVAIPLAVFSALHAGQRLDRIITTFTSLSYSVPTFASSVILVYLVAVKWNLLPPNGWVSISSNLGQNLRHATLPVMTLFFALTPFFTRVLRGDIVSLTVENFVLTAKAHGLPDFYILLRHVLRPASLSLITISGIAFGYLFGGSIIVETYFGLPGVGYMVSNAIGGKDSTVVLGVVFLAAAAYLVINISIDVIATIIDPRVRAGLRR